MMTTMAALMGTLPIALGLGAGVGSPPAARPGGGRRPARVADADALRHADLLHLHGALRGVAHPPAPRPRARRAARPGGCRRVTEAGILLKSLGTALAVPFFCRRSVTSSYTSANGFAMRHLVRRHRRGTSSHSKHMEFAAPEVLARFLVVVRFNTPTGRSRELLELWRRHEDREWSWADSAVCVCNGDGGLRPADDGGAERGVGHGQPGIGGTTRRSPERTAHRAMHCRPPHAQATAAYHDVEKSNARGLRAGPGLHLESSRHHGHPRPECRVAGTWCRGLTAPKRCCTCRSRVAGCSSSRSSSWEFVMLRYPDGSVRPWVSPDRWPDNPHRRDPASRALRPAVRRPDGRP